MHRYLVTIPLPWGGSYSLPSYGFMVMCGFLLALFFLQRRARRAGIDPEHIMDAAIALLLGGILGARAFFVIQNWPFFRDAPLEIIRLDKGGLVFYGGLIGGGLALLVVMRRRSLPLARTLDLLAGVVPLGHSIGRIGCFLNGCCFGEVTDSWVGLRFPPESPAFEWHLGQGWIQQTAEGSLPVHPTQLYASGYNLAIFAVLSFVLRRRWREGEVAYLYCVLYGSARFVNEIFRADPRVLWGLTIAQVFCVPLVLFGLVMLVRGRMKPRQPLPDPWQPPPQDSKPAARKR